MAKSSGLGSVVTVDDATGTPQTISNDITNYQFATPRAVQDTTGVNKFAHERILLLADWSVTFNGVVNIAANMSHAVFSTVPSTSVNRTTELDPMGTSTGNPKLVNETLYTSYDWTRNNTGELTWTAAGALADGTVPTWAAN